MQGDPWWEVEGLDVDDSDLLLPSRLLNPSPLLPCNLSRSPRHKTPIHPNQHHQQSSPHNPTQTLSLSLRPPESPRHISSPPFPPLHQQSFEQHHHHHHLIPGPAGVVQSAMRRHKMALSESGSPPQPQKFRYSTGGGENYYYDGGDVDFESNAWLCAMDFLGMEGSSNVMPISSIKTQAFPSCKVPLVVGIVKSCMPNGLGDLIITLKDTSCTISATIHRKVVLESSLGREISVGCVLFLRQVVVFSPVRSAKYLNITLNNLIKIIAKDSGSPRKRESPPSMREEHVEVDPRTVEGESLVRHGEKSFDHEEARNSKKLKMVCTANSSGTGIGGTCASASVCTQPPISVKPINDVKKLIPTAAIGQWTDEQLNELFADSEE
ncbi:hypothetical protein QJS04_geneDACA009277 [Acorus gramineus]|uniref:Homologous recombination OB-fold protein OB-fold domain-containing protein n=1 Tax=Acorus gramineus TaxID=55184 RepID=A0AAV9A2F9_ACOGR|nr:hypothetical protein QJS04_geneDACA009277 [Acorus gramineus]